MAWFLVVACGRGLMAAFQYGANAGLDPAYWSIPCYRLVYDRFRKNAAAMLGTGQGGDA
jgi:hypothetical protein